MNLSSLVPCIEGISYNNYVAHLIEFHFLLGFGIAMPLATGVVHLTFDTRRLLSVFVFYLFFFFFKAMLSLNKFACLSLQHMDAFVQKKKTI